MGMFWAKLLVSLGSIYTLGSTDTQGSLGSIDALGSTDTRGSLGSVDSLGSTDRPKRGWESLTWCLDCQHTSTFCEVFSHFPNNLNSCSTSLFPWNTDCSSWTSIPDSHLSNINGLTHVAEAYKECIKSCQIILTDPGSVKINGLTHVAEAYKECIKSCKIILTDPGSVRINGP